MSPRDWNATAYGPRPRGYAEPEETVPVIHRSMRVLFDAFAAIYEPEAELRPNSSALDRQLRAWARRREGDTCRAYPAPTWS